MMFLFQHVFYVKSNIQIPLERLLKSFVVDVLGCNVIVIHIGDSPKFLWIPARKKYAVTFQYRLDAQLILFKDFMRGLR